MVPVLKEKKWVIITWAIMSVLMIFTNILFIYLWTTGEFEDADFIIGGLASTMAWILIGVYKDWFKLVSRFMGFADLGE